MRAVVNRRTPGSRRTRASRKTRATAVLCFAATLGWSFYFPDPVLARVNPLVIVERQIHKGNMLIVLDTSGSMTGVPGGLFVNSSEAGVDCDNGDHCRNGGVQGLCRVWGRVCQSDDDCRTPICQKDGATQCSVDSDCPQDPGICSLPTTNCTIGTLTQTVTTTNTVTKTATTTNTTTTTDTNTLTGVQTVTDTTSATSTRTGSKTDTVTQTRTGTNTNTPTRTRTVTDTDTVTKTRSVTDTDTVTRTRTVRVTDTDTNTRTINVTNTLTNSQTTSGTATATVTISGTITGTNTAFAYDSQQWWTRTKTTTSYLEDVNTATAVGVATATYNGTVTAVFTLTGTITGTAHTTDQATVYFGSWDWYSTESKTGIGTAPATVTATGIGTDDRRVTWTYTGIDTWTYTRTGTNTQTYTTTHTEWDTQTYTATQTSTDSQSYTTTQTSTSTETYTITQTATGTQSYTTTKTSTGTLTDTTTQTSTRTQSSTTTNTSTNTHTASGTQTVTDTETGTATQTSLGSIDCTVSQASCTKDTDCPTPSTSVCAVTGTTCAADGDCPAVGRCKYTSLVCPNPGGNCANVNVCSHATSTTCTTPADCPALPGTGTCTLGGTPSGGCAANGDCPSYKHCSATNDSCSADGDCPQQSSGTCSSSGSTCSRYRSCPSGQTCVYASQTCNGTDNVCSLPQDTCVAKTDNACSAATNTCGNAVNHCILPTGNVCLQPASLTDTCVESTNGPPGPLRMCIHAQTVCRNNVDCKTAGDACGPATSRAVIAKRAISSVVQNNYKLLNFGLMTFYQDGYFPYFLNTSGNTGVITLYESLDKLTSARCLDHHWGPAHSCRINGNNMTLRDSPNSRYRVRTNEDTWIDVDADYCGRTCNLPGDLGFGYYEGSYYQYTAKTGGNSTTMSEQPTYTGQDITLSGQGYSYYQPLTNYYNGGKAPPLDFPNCGSACSAECGGRWDSQLAPFLDTSDNLTNAQAAADAITRAMSPAAGGGIITYWNTPTGCTLQNDKSATIHTSAYDYMNAVKNGSAGDGIPQDTLPCRDNYVLLITDGDANGPGDNNCSSSTCAASNPKAAGCTCKAVLAAYNMRINLGVRTFVVGFSGDVSAGNPRITNDNIAKAGGTDAGGDSAAPFAFIAQNEADLNKALQLVIYDAAKGSYSTAPTSTSAGTQQATTVAEGRYALDSRMDFPEWRGHLLAYDLAGTSPVLAWDSYQKMLSGNWWERRVYTWDGNTMVKLTVDPATKAVTNKAALATIGLGVNGDDAERIARWLMGDPLYGNPAVLGAIVNSTPIDIASPGNSPEPGGNAFYLKYQDRPHLIYVGSSDGLLHAFFLVDTTVGGKTYSAGTEAFAFLPPDLIPSVRQQYAQGGQKPDPYQHVFGLADSPKAKSMCVRNCGDAATAVWKTLLLMPEGYGGSNTFMLDVTAPFDSNGIADPPVNVQWHTGYGSSAATYQNLLGNTISLPAYFFNKSANMDDYRIGFTSGYSVTDGSTTQGRALITASAATGAIISQSVINPAGGATCSQEYTALTDFATARDFATKQDNKLLAGYFGDTSGQLFRYTLAGGVSVDQAFTCNHPLHFAPTVVQLDRDAITTSFGHEVFPVQVTNSNLDFDTENLPPSKIVIWKEDATTDADGKITAVARDSTWASGGQITLTVGNDNQICAVTQTDTNGVITCKTSMPLTARPTATPLGVLMSDASGFQILTMWYVARPDGCSKGQTYFTAHRIYGDGSVSQRVGAMVANEPVTSPVILRGRVFLFGASGAIEITNVLPDAVTPGRAVPPNGGTGQFQRLNWMEVD
jgi:hypothetical protein